MMYLFTYEHTHFWDIILTVYSNEQNLVGKTGDYYCTNMRERAKRASASELGTVYFHVVS